MGLIENLQAMLKWIVAGTEVARLNEEFERCVFGAGDTSMYLNKQQRRGTILC